MKKIIPIFLLLLVFNTNTTQAQFAKVAETPEISATKTLETILYVSKLSLTIVFILSLILSIIAGVYLITAGGDEGLLEKGHKTWQIALGGFSLAFLSYIIVHLIKFFT